MVKYIPQGGGSLAAVDRIAHLSWLVCSSVEGVAKDFSLQPPRRWPLYTSDSDSPLLLVALLFCVGASQTRLITSLTACPLILL